MAKKHLEQYDGNGNRLDIYLNDDEVMVGNQTLTDKLSEMESDIEDAASQGGITQETDPTVPAWAKQQNKPTYTAQEVGAMPADTPIPDVSGLATKTEVNTGLAGKVDKNGTDSLMTDAEHTKLQNLPSNPVQSISVNGGAAQTPTNGNVNINVDGVAGKSAYQVALDNGFSGTEAQWLASLKGAKGDKGDKGDTVVLDPQGLPQFSVVNDLTTGGEGDALSAEQGKVLKGLIDNIGTGSISAFADYAVAESVSALPATGVATTGYIVGNHIYAYVGTGGDTRDGKYQDLGELNAAGVSLTTNGDGTFTVHAGGNDYTVNLNHTHENMAKLVVCEESDLPSTLDPATIYAITDSGETEIEKLIIRGMEFAGGGGTPSTEPKIVSPIGTQIDFNGESTKTVTVRASNLSEALTIAVTGITASLQTISVNDAADGVQLTLTKDQNFDGGTLRIYSSEVDKSWTVIESQGYQHIAAVKLTGTQWLQTDYCPNANTQIEMTCMFSSNSNTGVSGYKGLTFLYAKTDNGKFYRMYHNAQRVNLIHVPQTGTADLSVTAANLGTPNSVIKIDNVAGSFSFAPGGSNPSNKTFTKRTATSPYALEIGRGTYDSSAAPDTTLYGAYDLVIYSLVIKEAGTVVRNYQPKSLNGVPGLYDTINDNFISSETSDELVAIQNS